MQLDAQHNSTARKEQGGTITLSNSASFEIILKIQETCNLNCSYCYMYNMGNTLFQKVPTSAPMEVCEAVARLIVTEFKTRNPTFGRLIFHGGEPMLMPVHQFEKRILRIKNILSEELGEEQINRIQFGMQTNATLVSEAWVDVISRHDIGVSFTIDGPREVHDIHRVDKHGRGSYSAVLEGIKLLNSAVKGGRIKPIGCLSVINPDADGARAYRHIVDDLGITRLDFLLPFWDWVSCDEVQLEKVQNFLEAAFREWVKDDPSSIDVRIFKHVVSDLLRKDNFSVTKSTGEINHYFIVVESDGSIMPEESLRPRVKDRFGNSSVHEGMSFSQIISETEHQIIVQNTTDVSFECMNCDLVNSCGSGRSISRIGMRYDENGGFERKTVFCSPLYRLYMLAAKYLCQQGVDLEDRIAASPSW